MRDARRCHVPAVSISVVFWFSVDSRQASAARLVTTRQSGRRRDGAVPRADSAGGRQRERAAGGGGQRAEGGTAGGRAEFRGIRRRVYGRGEPVSCAAGACAGQGGSGALWREIAVLNVAGSEMHFNWQVAEGRGTLGIIHRPLNTKTEKK